MPNIGDRVHAKPRSGLQVQRGDGLYTQMLPPEGQEVLWDDYLQRRCDEGALTVSECAPAEPVESEVA